MLQGDQQADSCRDYEFYSVTYAGWIIRYTGNETYEQKGEPKHKLYSAYLDKVRVKTMGTLTSNDLGHQNPEINSQEELVADFEKIYKRRILMEDTVTVIYFTEVHEDL